MLGERRNQVLGTVLVALLTLVVVAPLTVIAYRRAVEGINNETADDARWRIRQAGLSLRSDEFEPPGNTWFVDAVDGWVDPLGETWAEVPVLALATPAIDANVIDRYYEFEGSWLIHAEKVSERGVLLTAVNRDDDLSAIGGAKVKWTMVTLALAALAGTGAWFGLGYLATPMRKAQMVNRDFIADAAHELRTPLSIIQASAGHALARERSADDYRESLTEILTATERAGASVGELLEFARLEAGQASPRLAPLRLDLMVEEVASSIRIDGVVVEAIPGEAAVIEADYNLVRQVVDNIARNAAARSTKVTLQTHLETRRARIEVADDGPGFDPGIIDHVFERFRRGDRSGSVGLGMAIARTIVELHGGQCEATNLDEGGAKVTVWLPYKPTAYKPSVSTSTS